jgi:pectate lyase
MCVDRKMGRVHELKYHYPYYTLMWDVDHEVTREFIESFWSAHIRDWSNLDMDRHGDTEKPLDKPWGYEYDGGPVFFRGKGYCAFNAGSDLFYAAAILFKLSGREEALVWGERLAHRYVETRNPKVGISGYVYSRRKINNPQYHFGDDFKGHLVLDGTLFPAGIGLLDRSDALALQIRGWICELLLGDLLGVHSQNFKRWTMEELTAWGKVSYRPIDNSFIPMLIDGTSLEGYVYKRDGYYGTKGTVVRAQSVGSIDFWAYSLAHRISGDEFMWEMARNIALGNNLGDIGLAAKDEPQLYMHTNCSDSYLLMGFLQLYQETQRKEFLKMAQSIGNNILSNQFHKGSFVKSERHLYARLDCIEPLVLLHLYVATNPEVGSVPCVWPSESYFQADYRHRGSSFDINLLYTLTETPEPPMSIHEAAAIGDIEKIESLIAKGTDVNARLRDLRTPLIDAAENGCTGALQLLLARGANIEARDAYGCSALHRSAEKGCLDIAALLIANGADANVKNSAGRTPLYHAVHNGQEELAKLLIANGADVNAGGDWRLLNVAVQAGHTGVVELLIANGADVNAGGSSALKEAVRKRRLDITKLLIIHGANVNAGKWTALHVAVDFGWRDMAELLIAKGADVNAKSNNGRTPLHLAARYSTNLAKLLVSSGADINIKDNDGKTPLYYAIERGHTEVVELLRKHGAKEDEAPESGSKAERPSDPNDVGLKEPD